MSIIMKIPSFYLHELNNKLQSSIFKVKQSSHGTSSHIAFFSLQLSHVYKRVAGIPQELKAHNHCDSEPKHKHLDGRILLLPRGRGAL